jgi:hypothetical protein
MKLTVCVGPHPEKKHVVARKQLRHDVPISLYIFWNSKWVYLVKAVMLYRFFTCLVCEEIACYWMAKLSSAVGSEYLEFLRNLFILFRDASVLRIVEWLECSLFKRSNCIMFVLIIRRIFICLMERRVGASTETLGSPFRRTGSFPLDMSGPQADQTNYGGATDGVKTRLKPDCILSDMLVWIGPWRIMAMYMPMSRMTTNLENFEL